MSFEPGKTWFVTFELPKSRMRPAARRSGRFSETFFTEHEAKAFARERHDEGLIVNAGTLNPVSPRQIISSVAIHDWIRDDSNHSHGLFKTDTASPVDLEDGAVTQRAEKP